MLKAINKQNMKLQKVSTALSLVLDDNNLLRKQRDVMAEKIDFIGTLPIVEPFHVNPNFIGMETIEAQTIIIKPVPYGIGQVLSPEEMLHKTISQKKEELATALARTMIDQHIVQFIHKPSNKRGGPLDTETLAVKLYCIPWQEAMTYNEIVREIKVLGHKADKNYAIEYTEYLETLTPEQRENWICGLWEEIGEIRKWRG